MPIPSIASSPLPAFFYSEMLPQAAASAHAATLTQMADGRLAAAWFAGSKEGAADVAIWFSLHDHTGWSKPVVVANRQSTERGTLTYVRKIGNPVIYAQGERLHLWYVSVSLGGWAGSSINYSVSTNGGNTWAEPRKLKTSPFANISTLVRTQPLPLVDGGFGLPVYHEFLAKHGEWLRLGNDGEVLDKVRMVQDRSTLQPAVVSFDQQRAIALLRDAGPGAGRVRVAHTNNGGLSWEQGEALLVPNPNSSIALLRLPSGRLLLAGNPQDGRAALRLWVSSDNGETWQPSCTVESAPNAEFSYPALLLGNEGKIHLAYTWRREGIKYASFSEAWLAGNGGCVQ